MVKKNMTSRAHCLAFAYPAQGHVNPMLQLSKLLEHEGVRVTLVTARFFLKNSQNLHGNIALETISDGFDNGGFENDESRNVYAKRLFQAGPQILGELVEKLRGSGDPVDCIIYDSHLPWVLDVAKRFGLVGASYLTQNMAVNSLYYHVYLGKLQVPLTEHEISLPALPPLQLGDIPSFFSNPAVLRFKGGQFSNIDKAEWVLCNTFYELEKEVADWTLKIWPKFRTVGPNIPSMFLDKRLKDDEDYGVAEFKNEEYMKWLDDKPKGSVVYVSFGSEAVLNKEQMEELACGLIDSDSYFLWVIRASEETKLPKDFAKTSEKGLVVTWCAQIKVLAHEAMGCFLTHCGWNSTLEALSLGVPMVVVPQRSDQTTNAKFIVDVWKMGIRAPVDEKGIVKREALKQCIMEIMGNEGGKEMKSNAIQWTTLAARAAGEGGSSHKNLAEFVNSLFHL